MLKKLTAKGFTGVPYLETSQLMVNHGGSLTFSTKKPNVIVGPNGAGKSALLTALSIRFLAYFTGISAFDKKYTSLESASEAFWGPSAQSWYGGRDKYLPGLDCDSDNAPVLYYRPNHLPGNERSIATAMMCGYFDEAKAYAHLTEKKSAGQAHLAVMARIMTALAGEGLPVRYGYDAWGFGPEPRELRLHAQGVYDWDHQAEALKRLFSPAPKWRPMILMDEPEQSLDALAESSLWKAIAAADPAKVQVIVATHSVYPILNPGKFNLIEAVPGYAESVRQSYA
jgi:hypothetical protein